MGTEARSGRLPGRCRWESSPAGGSMRRMLRKQRTCDQHHPAEGRGRTRGPAGPHGRARTVPPSYLSFVTKAILWDRGFYRHTDLPPADRPPCPCPRFLAHMKACPAYVRPPRFLSSYPRMDSNHLSCAPVDSAPRVPRTHDHANPQFVLWLQSTNRGQCADAVPFVPSPPAPKRPFPEVPNLPEDVSHTTAVSLKTALLPPLPSVPASPCTTTPQPEEVEGGAKSGRAFRTPPSLEREDTFTAISGGPDTCMISRSDFSQPGSSQFSRSTSLSSRGSSVLSGVSKDEEADNVNLSQLLSQSPSSTPAGPALPPLEINSKSPPVMMLGLRDGEPTSPPWHEPEFCMDGGVSLTPQSSQTISGPKWAFLPSKKIWQDSVSPRWPVLPPISPFRDGRKVRGSPSSSLSPAHSDDFDELDALAPHTGSVLSQELSGDDPDHSSSAGELSQLAASLALGCDSSDSASLSHIRLLLLDRHPSMGSISPPAPEQASQNNDGEGLETADGTQSALGLFHRAIGSSAATASSTADEGRGQSGPGQSGRGQSGRSQSRQIQNKEGARSPCSRLPLSGYSRNRGSACKSTALFEGKELHHGNGDLGNGTGAWCLARRTTWAAHGPDQEAWDQAGTNRAMYIYSRLQEAGTTKPKPEHCQGPSRFEDFEFLAKYCIFSQEKLATYKRVFESVDGDGDGYLTCVQVLLALKEVVPPEVLSEEEEIYVCRILELVDFRVADGLTDIKLFAVIASLAQKVAALDDFMRSLIGELDFKALELKLSKAKLFLFLVEAQGGSISVDQLLVELKAGGISQDHEEAVRAELRHVHSFDLLDFLAHLPLFVLIHNSVVSNPLDESRNL
ncbi:uncharacterized protein LOC125751726 isoform X2 [Brienomyrus brachyistius]|uniref:uncharacterized protein LOC125751726 isoform X2 n=1 Tax=Brienomyrus brachyistius TaxID=42636 RepID=UPI0020B44E31|nr:uncharacterized protein LOC125751726 isoform X2 [Brienomyrus brachyistius]